MIDELSIVIPTLNEEKYIGRLLESISKQDFKGKLQIIVVDGKSKDKTIEIAKKYNKAITDLNVIEGKRGISIQRNKGAGKAKHDYLLFLDADVVLPSNFIRRLLLRAKPNERFVSSTFILLNDLDVRTFLIAIVAYPVSVFLSWYKKSTSGFCILTTKENHKKVGGFRENLTYSEDGDYGRRSMAQGAKFHYYFYPSLYYSVRRLKRTGRLKWVFTSLWVTLSNHSAERLQEKVKYPYGIYSDK